MDDVRLFYVNRFSLCWICLYIYNIILMAVTILLMLIVTTPIVFYLFSPLLFVGAILIYVCFKFDAIYDSLPYRLLVMISRVPPRPLILAHSSMGIGFSVFMVIWAIIQEVGNPWGILIILFYSCLGVFFVYIVSSILRLKSWRRRKVLWKGDDMHGCMNEYMWHFSGTT